MCKRVVDDLIGFVNVSRISSENKSENGLVSLKTLKLKIIEIANSVYAEDTLVCF